MKLTAFIILAVALAVNAFGQAGADGSAEGARATLVRLVELNNREALRSVEARRLLVGEAAERWDFNTLGKLADAPDKVVLLEGGRAVGRVQWFGANDRVVDFYFYLRLDGGAWKVLALRRLALTGMLEDLYPILKAKKTRTEEEEERFANMGLVLSTDAALKDWFRQNRETLDRLAKTARAKAAGQLLYITPRDEKFPEVARELNRLHLDLVEVEPDGNVHVVIGGMTDNTVGFLHSPAKTPPPINPSEHIWVEEVADAWYLFRTT